MAHPVNGQLWLQKKDMAISYVEKIKPHIGDKAMTTSILNNTFKMPGVQHISTVFFKAKPSLML